MMFTPPFLLLINFQHFDFEDILVVSGVVRINMSSLPNWKIRMVRIRMVLSQIQHQSKLTKKLQISAMLSSGQSFKFQQEFLFIKDFMPNNCTSNKALFVQDPKNTYSTFTFTFWALVPTEVLLNFKFKVICLISRKLDNPDCDFEFQCSKFVSSV